MTSHIRSERAAGSADPLDFDIRELYGQNTKVFEQSSQAENVQRKEGCVIHQTVLFPGVIMVFQDIHEEHLDFSETDLPLPPDIISVQHCREGRFEGGYRNGECFYLGPGDLSVNLPVCQPDRNSFPLSHYHGLNIIIEPKSAQRYIESLEQIIGDLHIDLQKLSGRLAEGNHLIIYRENILEHILSEIYPMRPADQDGHIKLKVLELLHSLCSLDTAEPVQPQYFNRSQVRKVKSIHAYLTEDPSRHDTLEELSQRFDIPMTSMKKCFKGVYGQSIGAYMREYRLQFAAGLLREDTASIGDIAFRAGYESPSKFAGAFRRKFGCSPSSYRREIPSVSR